MQCIVLILLVSLLMSVGVTLNAYRLKHQFYPTLVYISQSQICITALYIQGFAFVLVLGVVFRKIFFGKLRQIETEVLLESLFSSFSETCLAFTTFSVDFAPRFVVLFAILLFLKVFHRLGDERIEVVERTPVLPFLFHLRVFSLLVVLSSLDCSLFIYAYGNIIKKGSSVHMIFGFEYAILFIAVTYSMIKYLSHSRDFQETNFDDRSLFILYTDLAINVLKTFVHLLLIVSMLKLYNSFPLYVISPLYQTIKSIKLSFESVVLSRRAMNNLNRLYPDVNPHEIEIGDVCVICREDLISNAKKLPCNHIFHTSCLRSWFQRQQKCPTCRFDVLNNPETTENQISRPSLTLRRWRRHRQRNQVQHIPRDDLRRLRIEILQECQCRLLKIRESLHQILQQKYEMVSDTESKPQTSKSLKHKRVIVLKPYTKIYHKFTIQEKPSKQ